MKWIIGIGIVAFVLFFTYSLLKVASDADDAQERWNEERKRKDG